MGKVTIIQGAVGSGKSVTAKALRDSSGARVFDDVGNADTVIVISAGAEVEFITTSYKENK